MTRFLRTTLLASATAAAFGVSGLAIAQDGQLKTDKDKVSYMVGMQIGSSLSQIKDEIDLAVVMKAIVGTLKDQKPLMTQEEAMEVQKGFAERLQAKRAAGAAAGDSMAGPGWLGAAAAPRPAALARFDGDSACRGCSGR